VSAPTFAVALGAGGARGLAHIVLLEAFDELGVSPVALAGTSMGAVVGAAYAAGMPARDMRAHSLSVLKDRSTLMAAVVEARVGRFADLVSQLGNPLLVDPERFLDRIWPEKVPDRFEDLAIPLQVSATDFQARTEAVFASGPLLPAVAASMAIPGLARPLKLGERLLVDGGATNPLPFDHLIGKADVLVALDVTGGPSPDRSQAPTPFDALFGSLQILQASLVEAKLKIYRPQVLVRPQVDAFRILDFFEARAIFLASEPAKEALKREIARHLEG
jgi:NTE family protein